MTLEIHLESYGSPRPSRKYLFTPLKGVYVPATRLSRTEELAARLYFEEGLKPKEIAQRLGISVNTVYKAISKYRALRKIEDDGEAKEKQGKAQCQEAFSRPIESEAKEVSTTTTFTFIIPSASNTPVHGVISESITIEREILGELRRIRELLTMVVEELQTLKTTLKERPIVVQAKPEKPQFEVKAELPDFMRDNPWIDVIRSIKTK